MVHPSRVTLVPGCKVICVRAAVPARRDEEGRPGEMPPADLRKHDERG